MAESIRVAILGYGNLGRATERAVGQNSDMQLVALFTRRDPKALQTVYADTPVYRMEDAASMKDAIDVLILCGGSATDLPVQSPQFASDFNIVDSFDTHANIPAHFARCDEAALQGKHTAMISTGWDPGLFSLQRLLGTCILPNGADYTFWGRGVSQGHSDAIRRIEGVKDAKQYTVPCEDAMARARDGERPQLTTREKHTRECYVVAEEGADLARIEHEIKTMPNYFADYDTTVHFVSQEELNENHGGMPHGGFVIRSGQTGENAATEQLMEFSIRLGSNPEFTANVLVCCARAVYRMQQSGQYGAKTILDVPIAYLSPKTGEELRKTLL